MHDKKNHINLDYLELMAGNDPQVRLTLLELLLSDLRTGLPQMRALFEEKKWTALQQAAHKMKSTLDYSGNQAMQQANLSILNYSGDQQDPQEIDLSLTQLEKLSSSVLIELEEAMIKVNF
ncbi:MAG: hypothetical protein DHS20C18_01460 [Saprospiraceae bacterium]|nr:MAG: hypothetical protein DHS20C18_01460 [Saprospiraceae bacterium]